VRGSHGTRHPSHPRQSASLGGYVFLIASATCLPFGYLRLCLRFASLGCSSGLSHTPPESMSYHGRKFLFLQGLATPFFDTQRQVKRAARSVSDS
jgi:hypothetical protein